MKYKTLIIAAVSIYIITLSPILMSGDGKYVGKIGSIDKDKKEVIVNIESGSGIRMGEELYVRIDDKVVVMEATFPMQTTARCKLLKTGAGYFKNLEQGMSVYKYDRAVIKDHDKKSTNKAGQVEKIGNIDMVWLPGDTFMMGSEGDSNDEIDEKPVHKVTVSAFYISVYEITQNQYKEIMGTNPSNFKGNNLPVEQVSWEDAMKFCKRFGKKYNVKARLPYEAEWEYACRAGTSTKYYWGDEVNGDYAWYDDNSDSKTHPVGQKKPNAFGLYDMSGNVWELCMDWYSDSYYASSPSDNPEGPETGDSRVARGSSWLFYGGNLRSASREWATPISRDSNMGFRIVVLR